MSSTAPLQPADRPRGAHIATASQSGPRLFHYPPGLRQPRHAHDKPHLSVVLAGSVLDESDGSERLMTHGCGALRADATRHAVRFGPAGAVILTVDLDRWPRLDCPRGGTVFTPVAEPTITLLTRVCTEGGFADGSDARIAPFVRSHPGWDNANAPAWLRKAADALLVRPAGIRTGDLARQLGVHRAHCHRLFERYYGLSPSVFRRRSMAAHALAHILVHQEKLADAAAAAGFADQSHMSRAIVESCGMTAGRIRALLGA